MHEKCHNEMVKESRKNVIISRGMPVFSRTLGTSGECDVVEFIKSNSGITLSGKDGLYRVYPIEYKHGSPKQTDEDIMQLAAEAICLEEMLMCEINEGAIFYGETKRRLKVELTNEIKDKVREMFDEMHSYMERGYVPRVKPTKSCNACSLKNVCIPKLYKLEKASDYLSENLGEGGDGE